eukprot:53249-Eustigmatos_ZCMA.PRE.2
MVELNSSHSCLRKFEYLGGHTSQSVPFCLVVGGKPLCHPCAANMGANLWGMSEELPVRSVIDEDGWSWKWYSV